MRMRVKAMTSGLHWRALWEAAVFRRKTGHKEDTTAGMSKAISLAKTETFLAGNCRRCSITWPLVVSKSVTSLRQGRLYLRQLIYQNNHRAFCTVTICWYLRKSNAGRNALERALSAAKNSLNQYVALSHIHGAELAMHLIKEIEEREGKGDRDISRGK